MSDIRPAADEPKFADQFRPTAEERAAWEAWRDAKQEERDQLQKGREAADGTPRPEPTRENHSRSVEEETAKGARDAFEGVAEKPEPKHRHVKDSDSVKASDEAQ